jgi:hypothetical protein
MALKTGSKPQIQSAGSGLMKAIWTIPLLTFLAVPNQLLLAAPPAGRVVWWGANIPGPGPLRGFSSGLLAKEGEEFTNVVSVVARDFYGAALRSDGTVIGWEVNRDGAFQLNERVLTNVAAIGADARWFWAIRRDGTVAVWDGVGGAGADTLSGLTNVIAVKSAGPDVVLGIKSDGWVLCRFEWDVPNSTPDAPANPPYVVIDWLSVSGQPLSNVVALADYATFLPGWLLALQRDGTAFSRHVEPLGGNSLPQPPANWATLDPAKVLDKPLSNVVAIASAGGHNLALERNGEVLGWGNYGSNLEPAPTSASNLTAIAAGSDHSLGLSSNGTVVAWGENRFGQTDVPAGLSNVTAIAAGTWFSLAVTTEPHPPSMPLPIYGRLAEMTAEADLVFKGEALSSSRITNKAFELQQMDVHATRFKVISVLKGDPQAKSVVFQHYTTRPGVWGGPP